MYVPKVIVPILTFNVPKLDVPKKHVSKVYVPKLSCTKSDLPPLVDRGSAVNLVPVASQPTGWTKFRDP